MKSKTKPKGGCQQHGFTYVGTDGTFTQIAWKDLKTRGEALHVHTGRGWKRIRDITDATKHGTVATFSIGKVGAGERQLENNAITLPTSLLSGGHVTKIEHVRELAKIEPAIVRNSNVWQQITDGEGKALRMLWNNTEERQDSPTDIDILNVLGECGGRRSMYGKTPPQTISIPLAVEAALQKRRFVLSNQYLEEEQGRLINLLNKKVEAGELAVEHIENVLTATLHFLGTTSYGQPADLSETAEHSITLLNEYADTAQPLKSMLTEMFGIPDSEETDMLRAQQLLAAMAITPVEALKVAETVNSSRITATEKDVLTEILIEQLQNGKTNIAGLGAIITQFQQNMTETVCQYGNVHLYLATKFPQLGETARNTLADLAGAPYLGKVTANIQTEIDRFDVGALKQTATLLAEAGSLDIYGSYHLAGRGLATFGDDLNQWLTQTTTRNASSTGVNRMRRQYMLPDSDKIGGRIQALNDALQAPAISATDTLVAKNKITTYSEIVRALRRQQVEAELSNPQTANRSELEVELGELAGSKTLEEVLETCANDKQILLELLPNIASSTKRIADYARRGDKIEMLDNNVNEKEIYLLKQYVGALRNEDTDAVVRYGKTLLETYGQDGHLLPPTKTLRGHIGAAKKTIN